MKATGTTTQSNGFLSLQRSVAARGYQRWLMPPCALAIHLCIGMAYGFSVFWLPLSRAIGIKAPIVCKGMTFGQAVTTLTCDWRVSDLTWTYSLFFVVLGASAAVWGGWLERAGPRKAGVVAACCWGGGIAIGAIGVSVHQLWLLWLGTGLIGGIGLGLGYISPVSTLIKWFPDKRGMATGMAIMGFGGGALIGSPLADVLMRHFASATGVGVWQTFLILAALYFMFMIGGALGYRVPPADWKPAGWTGPPQPAVISGWHVHLNDAHRTPQFWLIWFVLLLNVSASIGIIGVASPMVQEIFAGRLVRQPQVAFLDFNETQKTAAAAVGAAFVGFISLFNIGGRFFWASMSDRIGRKSTYGIMLALGAALYGFAAPLSAHDGALLVFALTFGVIASMYGGGFATVPAYLADIFGTQFVGAIHGRLLTAWSTAGVLGPLIVTRMRDSAITAGAPRAAVYPPIYLVLAGLLVTGFLANLFVRPVAAQFRSVTEDPVPARLPQTIAATHEYMTAPGRARAKLLLAWAVVGLPLAWGLSITATKALALLTS